MLIDERVEKAYTRLTTQLDKNFRCRAIQRTAEDLPDASFAGQQETFLNVEGLNNIFHRVHSTAAKTNNAINSVGRSAAK